jgi:hypothetical protein
VANDANCDNGLFCDGAETCDAVKDCQAGTPPDPSDGVDCTDDSCNESTDSMDNVANDANCDNGLFCDGAETCDVVLDCQPGSDPCSGSSCDDTGDVCVAPPESSSVHVASVVTGTTNAAIGRGNKYGTATVTVVDNNGNPPGSEYRVSGTFGGTFDDSPSGFTENGVITFTTASYDKGITVTFCVSGVVGADPYDSVGNGSGVTTCGELPGPVCGNNIIEGTEVCDGSDLGGRTCAYYSNTPYGTLACNSVCSDFDTTGCSATPQSACVPTSSKEKGPRCSDGIDNDCDKLVDLEDPDCQ